MVKTLVCLLLVAGAAFGQGHLAGSTGATSPDCVIATPSGGFSAAGRSIIFDNRKEGCVEWTLFWSNSTGSVTFSVEIDAAQDATNTPSTWSAMTASSGSTNPAITGQNGVTVVYGYQPWVSVNVNSVANGNLQFLLIGYRPSAGSNATNTTNAQNVQGAGAANATTVGNPVLIAGTDSVKTQTVRMTSAANLSTATDLGVITERGPRWSVVSAPAAGSQASASKGAGGAGVRHVVDCISFSASAVVAPALTALTINVVDNATTIWSFTVAIPASTGTAVAPHSFCGLNLIGTANQAMLLQFSASLASLSEAVSISGYDVN